MNVCFGTRVRGYLQVHVVRLPLATSLLHLYSTKALSTETSKTTKKDGSRFRLSHLLRRQRVTTLESLDHVRTKRSRSRKDVLSLLSNFASPENEHPPAFLPPKKLYSALLSERAKKRSKSVPSKSVPSKSQQEELSTFVTGWGKDELKPQREENTPVTDPFTLLQSYYASRERSSKPASRPEYFSPVEGSPSTSPQKQRPPHYPFLFTRQKEGLLEPSKEETLQDVLSRTPQKPVASLSHGLDRVLFNPGVHWVQDPRSQVYNFTPYLEEIPKVTDFAFERLPSFIKSSRDEDLWSLAKQEGRIFAGSTSSLSGMLSQIYFLLSEDKEVDISLLSQAFSNSSKGFTPGQRAAACVTMNYRDGVYSIDSRDDDGDSGEKNILTWMGVLLEKFLTMSKDEFASYIRSTSQPNEAQLSPMKEAYRYAKSERFVMRSQLDCHDDRLPGTGMFDIKTRACVPIRLDLMNFEENAGYIIKTQHGLIQSFEREYYDLIRSAFLKYSFQARIGNMDGVIVAYHNTEKLFGFQYVSLQEMDARLFGPGQGVGNRVFEKCIGLLEKTAETIIQDFPEQSIECTFETQKDSGKMCIWVETVLGDPATKPIKHYQVSVLNYVGDDVTRGFRAVESLSEEPWTVHYEIREAVGTQEDIRNSLLSAKARRSFAYTLPTGVAMEDAADFLSKINFTGKVPTGSNETDASRTFRPASDHILNLRLLARADRAESERLAALNAGKPKVVWKQEADISISEVKQAGTCPELLDSDSEQVSQIEDVKQMPGMSAPPTTTKLPVN